MHSRRLCTLLLGGWLGASLFMIWVANHNTQGVDRLLSEPLAQLQRHVREVGVEEAKFFLRYQAAELNRHFMYYWELFQIAFGVLFAIVLLFSTNGHRLMMTLAIAMVAVVATQHLTITPRIIEIGRGLDFATIDQMIAERQVYWNYFNFYWGLEIIKLAVGTGLAARLVISGGSGSGVRKRRKKLDTIDDADDGHVDG